RGEVERVRALEEARHVGQVALHPPDRDVLGDLRRTQVYGAAVVAFFRGIRIADDQAHRAARFGSLPRAGEFQHQLHLRPGTRTRRWWHVGNAPAERVVRDLPVGEER